MVSSFSLDYVTFYSTFDRGNSTARDRFDERVRLHVLQIHHVADTARQSRSRTNPRPDHDRRLGEWHLHLVNPLHLSFFLCEERNELTRDVSLLSISVITTPIERLKILQQAPVPTAATTMKNTVENLDPRRQPSLVSLLKTHSIRSLYRGFVPTLLRDTAYGPYFLMYEYVSRGGSFGLLSSPSSSLKSKKKADLREEVDSELWGDPDEEGSIPTSSTRILVAGGLAGIVGWGITLSFYFPRRCLPQGFHPACIQRESITNTLASVKRFPIDVVKTKMQATSLPSPPSSRHPPTMTPATLPRDPSHPYATMRSSFKSAYREGGGSYRVFVAGLGPTLVRSVPVNMVSLPFLSLSLVGNHRRG